MKRRVLIVILLILLSFGLYLGAGESRAQGQPATIVPRLTIPAPFTFPDLTQQAERGSDGAEASGSYRRTMPRTRTPCC